LDLKHQKEMAHSMSVVTSIKTDVIAECLISCVSTIFEARGIQDDLTTAAEESADNVTKFQTLSPEQEAKLREELDLFRLSLPGSGRSSVGGTSLSSGITLNLIDQVIKNVHLLTSEGKIEAMLPIYSRRNAMAIWNIVQKYI